MTDQPEKMPLTSMDIAAEKREALKQLFPEVFAEDRIDFDQLKRVLGEWVEPGKKRFGLTWPGKAECMRIIQSPSVATLKPRARGVRQFREDGKRLHRRRQSGSAEAAPEGLFRQGQDDLH